MNKYLISGDSFACAFVCDEEFNGCEIIIGTYEANDENEAKEKAVEEYTGLEIEKLYAHQLK